MGNNPPSCETLRKGVFGAGAAFIFLNCIVSELYYVFFSKAKDSFQPYGGEAAVGREPTDKLSYGKFGRWYIVLHTVLFYVLSASIQLLHCLSVLRSDISGWTLLSCIPVRVS